MNCLIGLSLTLLAIVAGMFLLAKTQKDNLGIIYKTISFFVIITGFLGFLGGMFCGLCRLADCGRGGCSSTENCYRMSCGAEGGMNCCKGMGDGYGSARMGCQSGYGDADTDDDCCKKKSTKKCKSWQEEEDDDDDDDDDEKEDIDVEINLNKTDKEKPAEQTKK